MPKMHKILFVEDDIYWRQEYINKLECEGFEVKTANNLAEAKDSIRKSPPEFVIIDIMMSSGEVVTDLDARGGFRTGVVLGKWLLKYYPNMKFIGFSDLSERDIVDFFNEHGSGYLMKSEGIDKFIGTVKNILSDNENVPILKSFIVHGRDEQSKLELKNYLQNTLKMPEPIILHEQHNVGSTIIEKFEAYSENIDIVFVLLTPDDTTAITGESNEIKRRARQNVIFEMGYFFGKMQRAKGKVILLYKGDIEIPSDINGIIYINIEEGILAAGEVIRREIYGSM